MIAMPAGDLMRPVSTVSTFYFSSLNILVADEEEYKYAKDCEPK